MHSTTWNFMMLHEAKTLGKHSLYNKVCMFREDTKFLQIVGNGVAAAAKSLQSCPTLCDPIESSSPGSSVPGILQAGTLEWAAVAFSENAVTQQENEGMQCPGEEIHMVTSARHDA